MHIREEIEKIVEWTKARIRWSKSEILKRLGVGRTQQSLFRRKVRKCGKRLRKINQITEEEKEKIIRYAEEHPGIGYMKLAYMMMDEEVAYVKPSSVYLVLKNAGFYAKKEVKSVAQAEFIEKPTGIHQMWHTDIAYIKILEVFYYLIVMLDGYSRYTLEWELLFDMRGDTVATFVQKVLDKYPEAKGKVKIVQDNGSCYVSYEYRTVLKHNGGIEPIYIGPYHPQTNGKAESLIKLMRNEAIRSRSPQVYDEAVKVLDKYFKYYNNERLHSGIGYLRPADLFYGRAEEVIKKREEGIRKAKQERKEWNINYNKQILNAVEYTQFITPICSV